MMALFPAVTLVPSVLLVALGWLLFQQDRATEAQQVANRGREAADLVVAELEQRFATTERALADATARRSLVTTGDSAIRTAGV